jgi:hypothetical protein
MQAYAEWQKYQLKKIENLFFHKSKSMNGIVKLTGKGLSNRVARSKKLKRPKLAIISFKKAKSSKMNKGRIKAKFSSKNCLNN